MATIRRRNYKYQVQVRKQNHKNISKTFNQLNSAKIWANHIENKLSLGDEFLEKNKSSLREIIQKYMRENC